MRGFDCIFFYSFFFNFFLKVSNGLIFTHFLVPSVEDPTLCGIVDFASAEVEVGDSAAQTLALVAKVVVVQSGSDNRDSINRKVLVSQPK